jgi:ABC-type antimicrobial peptide transport system permease subunit
MSFFTSGTFWFIEGIFFIVLILALRSWLKHKVAEMTWWKWILLVVWIFLAGFTAAFIGTNMGEGEYTAALRGGGGSTVIVLVYALVLMRVLGITRTKKRDPGPL